MQFDADNQLPRAVVASNGFELSWGAAGLAPPSAKREPFRHAAADQPEVIHHGFGMPGGSIPIEDLHPGAQR